MTLHTVCIAAFFSLALGNAETQGAGNLTVRIYNFAQVPGATLSAATEKATAVYRRAGIEIGWVNCPLDPEILANHAGCSASGTHMLTLKVLPESMSKVYYDSRHSLGFALLSERGRPTSDAFVFFDRVRKQAEASDCFLPTVLGYAMAHELGHLLLGKGSHSSTGIMKATWKARELKKAETGELKFSARQAKKIRAQTIRRIETQAARAEAPSRP